VGTTFLDRAEDVEVLDHTFGNGGLGAGAVPGFPTGVHFIEDIAITEPRNP